MTIVELRAALEQAVEAAEAIVKEADADNDGKGRPFTEEEQKKFDELRSSIENYRNQIEAKDFLADQTKSKGRKTPVEPIKDKGGEPSLRRLPAQPKRFVQMKSFNKLRCLQTRQEQQDLAHSFGMWAVATMGNVPARRYCEQRGLELRAHNESVNSQGGFLVPEEFDNALIDLREQFGVFRQKARIIPMNTDTKYRMRRTGGLTAYFTAEGGQITESTMAWDRVTLVAKDLTTISLITNDLNEDAMVNLGDVIGGEIAYAFANKEDECGFNGDGTSTYGGIIGVRESLKNLDTVTPGNIAGVQVVAAASSGNYAEIVLSDFHGLIGKLPQYADNSNASWYVHRTFWATVMQKLEAAAGGVTATEMIEGMRRPMFLGYPVVISQVMPSIRANNQICALLGDLSFAADFGDRKQTAIGLSDSATVGSVNCFSYNQIAIRGVERFDITVHDVGNASSVAASRVPGPIVGLMTAAS